MSNLEQTSQTSLAQPLKELFKHACLKPSCPNTYEDEDEERYYCPSCNEERKRIAAEVDRKLALRPRKEVKSLLQIYDESPKVGGFAIFRGQF